MAQSESNNLYSQMLDIYNRVGHIAVPYRHYVIVWGGFQGAETLDEINRYCPTNTVWLFNSLTEVWTLKVTTGDFPRDNSGSTGLVLDDSLYIFGGMEQLNDDYNRYTNSILRLDLKTFVWECLNPTGEQPLSCDKGTGWVYNNKLYFFGGYGQKPTNSNSSYNGSTNTEKFSYAADWEGSRPGLKGWNNQLVCYDPLTNTWSSVATKGKPPPPRAACDADIDGHRVFMFGGRLHSNRNNELYVLDMLTSQWTNNLTLDIHGVVPAGVSWHSFKLVQPNTFVLFGGLLECGSPSCNWWILEVDCSLNLCWKKREMPVPLIWHKAAFSTATRELIIIGGVCVSPYQMIFSDHLNLQIILQLQPSTLFRLCLRNLITESSTNKRLKNILLDSPIVEPLPSFIRNIMSKRIYQFFLTKIRITMQH